MKVLSHGLIRIFFGHGLSCIDFEGGVRLGGGVG